MRLKPSYGLCYAFLLQEEKPTFAQQLLEYVNISITLAAYSHVLLVMGDG